MNSLHLLLAFVAALSLITAAAFHRDTVEARRRLAHERRILAIRTQQLQDARTERDQALAHAEDAQQLLSFASLDIRLRSSRPSTAGLSLVDGGAS